MFKAHLSFYKHLRVLKAQRAENLKLTVNKAPSGVYAKNIVFKKFLSGVKKFSDLDSNHFS